MADVVHLRNGRTVRADSCREIAGELRCRKAGGIVGIPLEQVESVERQGEAPPAPLRPFRPGRSSPPEARAAAASAIQIRPKTAEALPGGPPAWRERITQLQESLDRPGTEDAVVRRELAVLRTLLGNEAAGTGDFDAAESHYMRATDHDPTLAPPRLNLARVRLQQGRNDEAEYIVRDVAAGSPDDPGVLALQGEIEYRQGRLQEAIQSWSRSLELQPDPRVQERLRKARREEEAEEGFFRADAPHFTLKYDGERASDQLSGQILDHLEETFDDLTARFNVYPSSVILVTLYSREAFHDVTESPGWVGGLFDGQIRVPIGGLTRLTQVARNVFTHELAHCIVYHKTRGNSPKWIQEGIAQWVEGKSARSHRRALASQLAGISASEAAARFSYLQSLSMLERFLSIWSLSHLLDLLDGLGRGSDLEAAFVHATGQEFMEFVDSWLRSLHAPGGSL